MQQTPAISAIVQTFHTLEEYQREILVMLLHGGLRASRQVATRLPRLRNRGLVVHVPSNAGAYWCLTDEGKKVALFALLHPTR